MFTVIRNAWKIPDVRKKILFTLFIILIFRLGCAIPVPFITGEGIGDLFASEGGNFFNYLDIMTGGGLSQASILSLGVTPYINASIIIQLLTVAIPALERLSKEGEEGRKTIAKITRYATVGFSLLLGLAYFLTLKSQGAVAETSGFGGFFVACVIILSFTAGSALVMWMGEQINDHGLGNGISIILFAGIISRGPQLIQKIVGWLSVGFGDPKSNWLNLVITPLYLALALAAVALVVFMSEAERRIPIQYAQRVVGRKVYGGQNTHIPIKVNMTGVMPIIFASTLVSLPGTIATFVNPTAGSFWDKVLGVFRNVSIWYAIIYFVLIIAFNYFYVSIQYNPVEIANNLRKNSGTVPGIRPGKPTSDFIGKIVNRVTLIGALLLSVIAVAPILLTIFIPSMDLSLGGTSLLIIVGVALETVRTLESQMMMRHYKGFLND